MGLTDRLAYEVVVNPGQAIAGFGQVGKAAGDAAKKADVEMARLQKRIDHYGRQAARSDRTKDPLGADVARVKAAELGRELDRLKTRSAGLRGSLDSVGLGGEAAKAGLALGSVAALKLGYDAALAADRLATAQRATDLIFKGSAQTVRDFARDADQALGLSETAALSATNSFGNVFAKKGANPEDAAKYAKGITALGSVLAAAHPEAGNTEAALSALAAALRGEFDPLERFGQKINATTVEQKALKLGLASTTSGLTEQHKQMATLQLLFEQTNIEQKLFAENTKTLAFEQQQAAAAFEDFKTAAGGGVKGDVDAIAGAISGLSNEAEKLGGGDGKGAFGKFIEIARRTPMGSLASGVLGVTNRVSDLARGFNFLNGEGDDVAATLGEVNNLNVIGAKAASGAAVSTKDLAAAQQKVVAANKERLSAAEGLLDADDRVVAAQKAVAEASDDVAEKAEKVADARRDEEDAANRVADAEDRLAKARRDAPGDIALAGIAVRDAQRAEVDAAKERDKQLRRRGATDPKTLAAQDRLAAATISAARAQNELNDLQGQGGIPAAVQDAIDARDDAMRAATDAEKRTREALAVNPYLAQQDAAKALRDAENDRLRAVSELNGELDGVNRRLLAGFDIATASRAQIERLVETLKQAEALRPSIAGDFGSLPAIAGAGNLPAQIRPDFGSIPAGGARTTVNQFGPNTIMANDPDSMARQLAARQRLQNLTGAG